MDAKNPATRYKVGRILEEDNFDRLNSELPNLWTGDGGEPQSLRTLSDRINQRVIETIMREAGLSPLEGEVENYYRLLTDDEVSSGDKTQAERTLERGGVDTGALVEDFITHQSVYTFLQKHHNAERTVAKNPRDAIQRLRGRIQAVTRNAIERVRGTTTPGFENFLVVVNIEVTCNECGERFEAEEVLTGAECGCAMQS